MRKMRSNGNNGENEYCKQLFLLTSMPDIVSYYLNLHVLTLVLIDIK